METQRDNADAPEAPIPGEAAVESPALEDTPKAKDKTKRNFLVGLFFGAILNLLAACGFFLVVADNPRHLLAARGQIITWLGINLAILAVMALGTRQIFQGVTAGFGLAAAAILSLDAIFMATNFPVPTQEAMCRSIREFKAVVEEGEALEADTPVEAAKSYYNQVGTTYRVSWGTIIFIDDLWPTYFAMRSLGKAINGLEGQEMVGTARRDIHSKVMELEGHLRPLVNKACAGQ